MIQRSIEIRLELIDLYQGNAEGLAVMLLFLDNQTGDNLGAAATWIMSRAM